MLYTQMDAVSAASRAKAKTDAQRGEARARTVRTEHSAK
jgi:hypothetical protein